VKLLARDLRNGEQYPCSPRSFARLISPTAGNPDAPEFSRKTCKKALQEALPAGRDLSGANLSGANLRRAICDGTRFTSANFENTFADKCTAIGADFSGARMTNSSWEQARLLRVTLTPEQKQAMGWLATARSGRFRSGGNIESEPVFGAGLCRLTIAELGISIHSLFCTMMSRYF
jgi:uncharacterized protein YjbI with pentapeptide repeats